MAEFARQYGLGDEVAALSKGAVLARGGCEVSELPRVTREEVLVLEGEEKRKWRQPWGLWGVVGVCSVGAVVQGMSRNSPETGRRGREMRKMQVVRMLMEADEL